MYTYNMSLIVFFSPSAPYEFERRLPHKLSQIWHKHPRPRVK